MFIEKRLKSEGYDFDSEVFKKNGHKKSDRTISCGTDGITPIFIQ